MKIIWPEVTDIKKIRDTQIVDIYVGIAHCEFQRVWIFDVSLTGSQTLKMQLEVMSFTLARIRCFVLGQHLTQLWQVSGQIFRKFYDFFQLYESISAKLSIVAP